MKKIFAAFLLLVTSTVGAGTLTNAKIANIRVDKSGLGIITFDISVPGLASCSHPYYYNAASFNVNTPGGKAILATALLAKAQNLFVSMQGAGACTEYGGVVESIEILFAV